MNLLKRCIGRLEGGMVINRLLGQLLLALQRQPQFLDWTKCWQMVFLILPRAFNIYLIVEKRERVHNMSLLKVVTVENVSVLLDNPTIRNELFSYIPESLPKTRDELESIIRSPQFQQVMLKYL